MIFMLEQIFEDTKKISNPEKAKQLMKFFKTGKGEYGEGDLFLGIQVPEIRKIAKKYLEISFFDLTKLISDKYHEHRLLALLFLVQKYKKIKTTKEKKEIIDFYLKNTKYINNWDLVDLSAPYLTGDYFLEKDKKILYDFVKSKNIWEKRIAIISTYCFIKNNNFEDTLRMSLLLLTDKHDLIHKAVGWMLREVGKKNKKVETEFLNQYYKQMPRTMLRYAIEKFPEKERQFYLKS